MTRRRPILAKLRAARTFRRFCSNDQGATAVEFAFIALPFFGILFAIMQTSLVLFVNQALQTMTTTASRRIMTGEINTATGLDGFKEAVCGDKKFFDCNKIMVQVKAFDDFSAANATDPDSFFDDSCFTLDPAPSGDTCWKPGGPRSVVMVRVAYEWPFAINLESLNSKTLLVAVSAFRNEPF